MSQNVKPYFSLKNKTVHNLVFTMYDSVMAKETETK